MLKNLIALILVFLFIFILISLGRQIVTALDVGRRMDRYVEEVSQLQTENKKLKTELAQAQKYEHIEQIARDKLNMSRPNETVVIIESQAINNVLEQEKPKPTPPPIPNWQKWSKLFGLY